MRYLYIPFILISMFFVSCQDDKNDIDITSTSENIDSLLLKNPENIDFLVEKGNQLVDNYEYDQALEYGAKAFRLDTSNFDARFLYANILNNRSTRTVAEISVAQRHFHVLNELQPKNLKVLVALGSTYAFQQDFEKTFKYSNDALKIDKKYRDAYVLKGTTYRQIGNIEKAKSSYQTAIEQDPEFFEAYFFLGQMYQGELDSLCIQYFQSAHELQPEATEITYQLAYSEQLFGSKEVAMNLYREMAQTDEDLYISRGLFHIGYIHQFDYRNIDSAEYYYKSSLRTEPRYVEAWHNLGLCFEAQNDRDQALKCYSKALTYNPDFELSKEAAERLR